MEILYERAFYKDLANLADINIRNQTVTIIELLKKSEDLTKLQSIRKLTGYSNYYRIQIGDFRPGIKYHKQQNTFVRLLHRKEIYSFFL